MEFFTELFLVALPFFILGYVTGKVQNELDKMFLRECSHQTDYSEEEESPILTEEKLKRVEKWEKQIYDIKKTYDENQVFSHPSKKYVCLREIEKGCALFSDDTADEISKIEIKILDFFREELLHKSVKVAKEYVAEYGYQLVFENIIHLPEPPQTLEEGTFLFKKKLFALSQDKKNNTKMNKKRFIMSPKDEYITSIMTFSYEVC